MIRAEKGYKNYWNDAIGFSEYSIRHRRQQLLEPAEDKEFEPQYAFGLVKDHYHLLFEKYSRGDPIRQLGQYFPPLLDAWEEANRLGKEVATAEQQYTRRAWVVNFDHYIVCFWLVGFALALDVPDDQWQRLIRLVGNEGEDALLDRVIATRSPTRKIGTELCFAKPYARLLAAVTAPADEQAAKLREFLDHWYPELAAVGKSGRAKQASSYVYPYWYKLGDKKLDDSGYFGRWCVEAVAVVKAFHLDDSLCLGHQYYPGDLLRPDGPSTHPVRSFDSETVVRSPEVAKRKAGLLARLFGQR